MENKKSSAIWWIIGLAAIALVLIIIASSKKSSSTPSETTSTKTTREVALTCTSDMATQFHIHPVLKLFINGKQQEVPAEIGITPTCLHSLHTHDNSGTIHVESPEKRDFTLADFFAVWGKTFTKDQILDYKADAAHKIEETVNGARVNDYENTILRDGDQINIYYEEINPAK